MPVGQEYKDSSYLLYAWLQDLIAKGMMHEEQAQSIMNTAYSQAQAGTPLQDVINYGQVKQWQETPVKPETRAVPTQGVQPPLQRTTRRTPTPAPSVTGQYYPFLETLGSPAMKRWAQGQLGTVATEFEAQDPGARQRWWKRKFNIENPWREWVSHEVEGGVPGTGRWRSPPEVAGMRRAGIKAEDPFKKFLEDYPFAERFRSLPPRERGFFPRTSRPPARWLTF